MNGPKHILDTEISGLCLDSRLVKAGDCFFAISGNQLNGNNYIEDAIAKGAACIISNIPIDRDDIAWLCVDDVAVTMGLMAAAYYDCPSMAMKIAGITGTNGKTTITYLLEKLANACGFNPGVIGTIAYRCKGYSESASHTTPQSIKLQSVLHTLTEKKVDLCAMEVSSHSLKQYRVMGCEFDCAVFTNLTPEHLDYHLNMDDYFLSKAKLFTDYLSNTKKENAFAVINYDDPYGRQLSDMCTSRIISYGLSNQCACYASDIYETENGLSFMVHAFDECGICHTNLYGQFNVRNVLAAISVGLGFGWSLSDMLAAFTSIYSAPGRLESISNNKNALIFVDYAHTSDALDNVLTDLQKIAASRSGRLIVVFGCGGDRDKVKRPLMGASAVTLADHVIITNDNPRTENPSAIIDDIVMGIQALKDKNNSVARYDIILDREDAIAHSISDLRSNDVLLIAGKGHEDYQLLGTERIYFDDVKIVEKYI